MVWGLDQPGAPATGGNGDKLPGQIGLKRKNFWQIRAILGWSKAAQFPADSRCGIHCAGPEFCL